MVRFVVVLWSALMGLALDRHQGAPQLALWQADLQIQSLTISEARGQLTARLVIETTLGEALAARVEVLLPVGVGIVTLGSGCAAGPNVTGIRELRGRVECSLGNLPARSRRELFVVTTAPPLGVARGFAAVVMSETPDPKPANNFAERVIPQD
jgi:hypothetical protein